MSNFDLDWRQIIYRKDTLEVSFPRKLISRSIKVFQGQYSEKRSNFNHKFNNLERSEMAMESRSTYQLDLSERLKEFFFNLPPQAEQEAEGILEWAYLRNLGQPITSSEARGWSDLGQPTTSSEARGWRDLDQSPTSSEARGGRNLGMSIFCNTYSITFEFYQNKKGLF